MFAADCGEKEGGGRKKKPKREMKGRVSSVASWLTFGSTAGGDSESCSVMSNDVQKRAIAP